MLSRKGQSTLEYVIVFTAITTVIIIFAGSALKTHTQQSLEHVAAQMQVQIQKVH